MRIVLRSVIYLICMCIPSPRREGVRIVMFALLYILIWKSIGQLLETMCSQPEGWGLDFEIACSKYSDLSFWQSLTRKLVIGLLGLFLSFIMPLIILMGLSKLDTEFCSQLRSTGSRSVAAWGVATTIVR